MPLSLRSVLRRKGWPPGAAACLVLLLSGCATVNQQAGFAEVRALVEARSGMQLVWNRGTALDAQAAEKVRALLQQPLTADAAVQVALLNNRDLQALYAELGVAQADLVQAGLLHNPVFDGGAFFPLGGGQPDLELGVALSFLDVFYRPLRRRVAAAQFEAAKLRVSTAVLELAGAVRAAFYRHQANAQLLELRRTVAEALAASLEVARRLHAAGNLTDLDLARERALAEDARLQLAAAELAVQQSREQLNALLGLWGEETQWQVAPRLPEVPEEEVSLAALEAEAVARSLDLAVARQRLQAAGELLGLSRATALVPELPLGTRAERNDGEWEVGPVLELPLPLFDQGRARIGRALAELRRAQQQHYALAVTLRATARALREQLRGLHARALYYRDILLPLHERIVNEAQLQYNAMQLGVFELLRAREQQIQTAVAYVETLRDYWLARAALQQLRSGSLPRLEVGVAAPQMAPRPAADNHS